MSSRRAFLVGGAGVVGSVGLSVLAGCNDSATDSGHWVGTLVGQPEPRPSFTLTDTSGAAFDFKARTAGRPTLLFFGYTSCPDICTPTMADIQAALLKTTATVRSQVMTVFATTDAERDTGPVLRSWLDQFNSGFVGLTGTADQLVAAQQAVGVTIAEKGPDNTYGHAAQVTSWATDDLSHTVYLAGTAPSDLAHDLPLLVHPPR